MTRFRSERFANGIELTFIDCSNRYFGDYHRVSVEILLHVPTPGGPLALIRKLERMAVPGSEVAAVRNRLADDFLRYAGHYLARDDSPARLVLARSAGYLRR